MSTNPVTGSSPTRNAPPAPPDLAPGHDAHLGDITLPANILLEKTFASLTEAVLVVDSRRGVVIAANPALERMFGHPLSTVIGQSARWLYVDPEDSPDSNWREAVPDRDEQSARTIQMRRRDGEVFYAEQTTSEIRDDTGEPRALVSVIRDLTEQRQSGEATARLAAIVESSDDAIVGKSLDGTITSWNPAAERLFGYRAEEVIGKRVTIIYPPERSNEFEQIISRIKRGEHIDHYETQRLHRDGQRLDISVTISPIKDRSGKIIGASKIARNITERKREQDARHFLAEATSRLSTSLDIDEIVRELVRLVVPFLGDWCIVYGKPDGGAVRRLAFRHINPELQRRVGEFAAKFNLHPEAENGVPYVLRTGDPLLYPEVSVQAVSADADQPEQLAVLTEALEPKSWMCVPLYTRGSPSGAISIFSSSAGRRYSAADLTVAMELAHRAALAMENARLYNEAQDAIRLRDQFLSIASHELKTPLTSLLGYIELIKRRADAYNLEPRDRRALDTIYNQCLRLNRLVGTLLDLTRLQEGRLVIQPTELDLRALVEQAVREVEPTLEKHTIIVDAPPAPLIIQADELRMEQVLQNLIQNAIKYSPHGGIITIRCGAEGSRALFSIADQGIGIPTGALPRLFDRFYRAPTADRLQLTGLGIGLYVVNEIVTKHGGTIQVESREGEGTQFTIRLPLAQGAPTGPAQALQGG